jgi:hypothetical protein
MQGVGEVESDDTWMQVLRVIVESDMRNYSVGKDMKRRHYPGDALKKEERDR